MDNSEDEVLEMKTVPEVKLNKEREKPHAWEIEESNMENRKPRKRRPRGKFNYLHYLPQKVLNDSKTGRKREGFNIYNSYIIHIIDVESFPLFFCKLCKIVFRQRDYVQRTSFSEWKSSKVIWLNFREISILIDLIFTMIYTVLASKRIPGILLDNSLIF